VVPSRKFLREGELLYSLKGGKGQPTQCILFNDLFLITSVKYKYITKIQITASLSVEQTISDTAFGIAEGSMNHVFGAGDDQLKTSWVFELLSCIDQLADHSLSHQNQQLANVVALQHSGSNWIAS